MARVRSSGGESCGPEHQADQASLQAWRETRQRAFLGRDLLAHSPVNALLQPRHHLGPEKAPDLARHLGSAMKAKRGFVGAPLRGSILKNHGDVLDDAGEAGGDQRARAIGLVFTGSAGAARGGTASAILCASTRAQTLVSTDGLIAMSRQRKTPAGRLGVGSARRTHL